jgi:hypothetical protein
MTEHLGCDPADARFKMIWGGAWRPVTYMRDRVGHETNDRFQAAVAVLYVAVDHWVSTLVSPGEIVKRDIAPAARKWDAVD